ncbi:hypothetical protein PQQ53_29095 [Paraburkholderia strydomiana]|uniref:hypothetical protein n=1 Tax=Paraburkholderia strydomiana TaxID=1245417 RepID=UPI0038B71E51
MSPDTRGFAPIGMRRAHTRVPFRFFQLSRLSLVTTQQASAAPRKSLTLMQLLGLIGAAGLIASILLNHLV